MIFGRKKGNRVMKKECFFIEEKRLDKKDNFRKKDLIINFV
ncbi:hypothetical protein RV11_GL000770 [Enterococcus phoeniculicola]|jgi:hypothetical protein|nr:hypothetical protein RV11_GL000770 [Enterococcus phoeniculicola]